MKNKNFTLFGLFLSVWASLFGGCKKPQAADAKCPGFRLIMAAVAVALLGAYVQSAWAAIPQSAKDDPRYALGYLVVTYYDGVSPDGTGDSRAGIQQAIDDAFDNRLVVLFPPGNYQVSDVLKCYYWALWDFDKNRVANPPLGKAHVLVGSSQGSSRPVIKLAGDAVGFDDPSNPRPVIAWHYFSATNASGVSEVEPDDPFKGVPENFKNTPNVIFGWQVRNIDIDLNQHTGAIGGVFNGAQWSGISDVRINVTDAYCGIYGIPGRNSFMANIEVEGGKYGIYNNGGAAGAVLVNARLYNQTEFALTSEDFCPFSVVGFDIKTSAPQAVFITDKNWGTSAVGTMTLVDGKIEMLNQGIAVNNVGGKNIYLENVYVKGSESLVKSGSQDALVGSDDWKRIMEYTFSDQQIPSGTKYFASYSLINGVKSQTPEPSTQIENTTPPDTLLNRHSWEKLPGYEGEADGTINPKSTPYNAAGNGTTDDWQAIQTAINDSPNGKVFLPKGNYVISKPLVLKPNTVLMGVDQNHSVLVSTSSWAGGSTGFMVESANDADAPTFFGFIGFQDQATAASNMTAGFINWRAGKESMIMMTRHDKKYRSYFGTNARHNFQFSGNAGGRHFISPHQEEAANSVDARQVYIEGTSQPLTFYGLNVECTKTRGTNPNGAILGSNIEIVNSSNIRIHSIKREGASPTIIIRDSRNIAVYGMGRLNVEIPSELGGYNQILGNNNNILFATVVLDIKESTAEFPILSEAISGQNAVQIDWPDNVSIYKRGELTDIYLDLVTSARNDRVPDQGFSMTCYPNPFSGEVNIGFKLPEACQVDIKVFNSQGHIVKQFEKRKYPMGSNQVIWNNNTDESVSGIYYIRMLAGENKKTAKTIIL